MLIRRVISKQLANKDISALTPSSPRSRKEVTPKFVLGVRKDVPPFPFLVGKLLVTILD